MDHKALESPELRTQHILTLHQELLERQTQIKMLEQALQRVCGFNSDAVGESESEHNQGMDLLRICL